MSATALAREAAEVHVDSQWSLARRVGFRFAFAYLILYNLPLPIGALPWTESLQPAYDSIWHPLVAWVGRHILSLQSEVATRDTGSGDRTYDWILVLCYLTLAAVATLIWSAVDRKRFAYTKLDRWLRLYVRLALACWMITYGGAKAIPSQFTLPGFTRLLEPYGESSPMGLLWTFMGASPSYTILTGCVELLAGVLLILPRTAMLGAIVSFASMTQVFLLNMCYDVPVKLFSFHLILMSLFLLLPNMRRLANLFLLNRAVQPLTAQPFFRRTLLNRALVVFQIVFGISLLCAGLSRGYEGYMSYGAGAPRPPLYGIWSVEELSINGELLPPMVTDQNRWRRAIFQRAGSLIVQPMSGANQFYRLELSLDDKKMALTKPNDPQWKSEFSFEDAEPGILTLEGQLEGKPARAKLVRDESQFLLKTRGFHWISEAPFNR